MENTYNQPSPIQNPVTWTCERLTHFEMDPDVDYPVSYPISKNCQVYENIAIGDILIEFKQYRREDIRVMHSDPNMIPRVTAVLNGKALETLDMCDCVNMIGYSLTQFRTDTDKHELAVTALQSGMIDTHFTHCVYRYELEGKMTPPPTGWTPRDMEIIEPEFRPEDRVYVDKPSDATIALFERLNGPYILKPVLKKMSFPPKYHELKMYGGKVMQYTHVGRGGLVYYKSSAKYRLMFENGFITSEMCSGLLKNEPSHLTSSVILNNNLSRFMSDLFPADLARTIIVTRAVEVRPPHKPEYVLVGDNNIPEEEQEKNYYSILNYLRYCIKYQTPAFVCRPIRENDNEGVRVIVLHPKDLILPSRMPMWLLNGEVRPTSLDRLIENRTPMVMVPEISPQELEFIVKRT